MRSISALSLLTTVLVAAGAATPSNDIAQAWSYDDGWQGAWVAHCKTLYAAGTGKTDGFVLEIGDNITHAPQYAQWIRSGTGRTAAAVTLDTISVPSDNAIRTWALVDAGAADSSSSDGLWLARTDIGNHRGYSSAAGLDTAELLSGNGNGGTAMPDAADQATARTTLASTTYTDNIRLSTLLTAYANARFAVVEIGTYDALNGSINAPTFHANLRLIIDALEAKNIIPILSTIPPNADPAFSAKTDDINAAIRATAHERDVPLIDLAQEILNRQPTAWSTTLVSGPVLTFQATVGGTAVDSGSDPYHGGDPATYRTGDYAANVGYLLRDWLTFQKLKEVKLAVVDDVNTVLVSQTATGTGGTTTGGTTTGGGTTGPTTLVSGGPAGHHGCGRGGGGGLIVAAGLCLAATLRRQRR